MKYGLKALGVGGTLDQAIHIYKDHFGFFLAVMLCLQIPLDIITTEMFTDVSAETNSSGIEEWDGRSTATNGPVEARNFLIQILVGSISMTLSNAAIIHATSHFYLGTGTSLREAFRIAFGRLIPLMWTSALMSVFIMLGTMLCIVPGIIFFLRYSLADNIVVIEGKSGRPALDRSSELIRSARVHYWTAAALLLSLGAIHIGLWQATAYVPQRHVAVVVQSIVDAIVDAFGLVAFVVFYFSCRCRAENFDLMQLAQSVGRLDLNPVPPT